MRDECLQDSFHGHTNEPFDTQICSELTGQLYGQRLNLQKHILDVGWQISKLVKGNWVALEMGFEVFWHISHFSAKLKTWV